MVIDVKPKTTLGSEQDILFVEEIFSKTRGQDVKLPADVGPNDIIAILQSSGSTGRPKSIIWTNRTVLGALPSINHPECQPMTREDIVSCYKFFHSTGPKLFYLAMYAGAQLALMFGRQQSWEFSHKYGITYLMTVPIRLNSVLKNTLKYDKNYLKSLTTVISCGTPLSRTTCDRINTEYEFKHFVNSDNFFSMLVFFV